MSQHTPGPWILDGEGIKAIVRDANMMIVAIRHRMPGDAHEANMRLLAAAPDLLAALQEIVAMTNEDNGTFRKRGGTYRGLVGIMAADAIAKATGAP